ncbi:Vacuolar protein-sorting-associated protein [Dirofilaria immitis]
MSFKWPWQYEFPPFFTLQTTLETREKQLEAWSRLVVDYCQFHKIYTVDLADISNSELFINSTLNRKLSLDAIRIVFDYLENTRHIDWLDKGKNRCHIYWRRPEEWAILIYEWAVSNSLLNTPCTLYEITQGDDVTQESFYGLDKDVLLKSLAVLVEQRRAQLLNIGTGTEGVKFLQ